MEKDYRELRVGDRVKATKSSIYHGITGTITEIDTNHSKHLIYISVCFDNKAGSHTWYHKEYGVLFEKSNDIPNFSADLDRILDI